MVLKAGAVVDLINPSLFTETKFKDIVTISGTATESLNIRGNWLQGTHFNPEVS
jgi:hypothetical protein